MKSSNVRAADCLDHLTIAETAALVRGGQVRSVELVQECLDRIVRRDGDLHAFITVMAESALREAGSADQASVDRRDLGPLHGIPIAIKDMIDVAGVPTTCGSALFRDRLAESDADCVRRLRAAGAVILGKTNTHEFAFGTTNATTAFGPCANPHDTSLISGGSSGGSAVAVATRMCFAALGTDTGGSIRIPSSFCGVVGFKPTIDSVSTDGVFPLSQTMDHVGPITRNVEDAMTLHEVLTRGRAAQNPAPPSRPVIGIPKSFFWNGVDESCATCVRDAIVKLRQLGEVRQVDLPFEPDFETYRIIGGWEANAIHREWLQRSPERYQPLTRARLESTSRYTREHYEAAASRLASESATPLSSCDFLATPTMKVPPPTIADCLDRVPLELLHNTFPFNMWGLPAITLPLKVTGLPVGLQLAAAHGRDAELLQFALRLQKTPGLLDLRPV